MIRSSARTALVSLLASALGCAPAMTGYDPVHVGPAELTLRYEKGVQVHSGRQHLTNGPVYRGLAEHVRCVPKAYEHARYAEKHGRARRGLAWSGGAMGVASLGGLSGFAFLEEEPKTAFALLGAGLGVAVLGIVLAGASRSAGNQAHGNAIDAINYYNDAVGSVGGSCADVADVVDVDVVDVAEAKTGAPPIALLRAPQRRPQRGPADGKGPRGSVAAPVEGPTPPPAGLVGAPPPSSSELDRVAPSFGALGPRGEL